MGTNIRTNNEKSLFEFAKDIGYTNMKIVKQSDKIIKQGNITFENWNYIKSIYPKYELKTKNNNLYISIQIIEFSI